MQKIIPVSINPAKHSDITQIMNEIKKRKMSLSKVVRQLLRNFKANEYSFEDKDKPAI